MPQQYATPPPTLIPPSQDSYQPLVPYPTPPQQQTQVPTSSAQDDYQNFTPPPESSSAEPTTEFNLTENGYRDFVPFLVSNFLANFKFSSIQKDPDEIKDYLFMEKNLLKSL
jgi:hypothetical protein